jgi:hypothetical protein
MRRRRAFALMTVLWVLVAASTLAMTGATTGRESVAAALNRVDAERAHWRAIGCIERVRARIDLVLSQAARAEDVLRRWRALQGELVMFLATDTACTISLSPVFLGAIDSYNVNGPGNTGAWIVMAQTSEGRPPLTNSVDAYLILGDGRALMTRLRSRP